MHCFECDSREHNIRTCPTLGKAPSRTTVARRRIRGKKRAGWQFGWYRP